MELWIDTVDVSAIKNIATTKLLTGVTSNPLLLAESRYANPQQFIAEVLELDPNLKVAAQVIHTETSAMLKEARILAAMDQRVLVKIPLTAAGIPVITQLVSEGFKALATAIYTPEQVLLAAMAGAVYAAPYWSRMEKEFPNSLELLRDMNNLLKNNNFKTSLLVASVKNVYDIMQCAKLGVQAITIPPNLYGSWTTTHPLTAQAIEQFFEAWNDKKSPITV